MNPDDLRFWSKVNLLGDCWLWMDEPGSHGYGSFSFHGKVVLAHVHSYRLAYGKVPMGKIVDHRCHTPLCVRPKHLRDVTYKQNTENIKGLRRNNTSGYQGVSFCKATGRWRAYVDHHDRRVQVGYFNTPQEAGEAALQRRLELFTHNDLDREVG